jgi:hypothetical protein
MPINLESVFKKYTGILEEPVIAVETGCSYYWTQDSPQYLSTPCIVKYLVKPTIGVLYSFDIDESKIKICYDNMKSLGLGEFVRFVVGDSVENIKKFHAHGVNFVWLDSLEDSNHAQAEFDAIQPFLADKHIICVDDYGCPNSVKWQSVTNKMPMLGYECKSFDTPTGLFIGVKR